MEKRSILVIYDAQNNVPNGDPFTNEQRYDNASEKIMISDVRMKRYMRDMAIYMLGEPIFYMYDKIEAKELIEATGKELDITGSAYSFRKYLLENGYIDTIDGNLKKNKKLNLSEIMLKFIDVRLFGGLLTDTGSNCSIEGAIQFKNLSYSLNKVRTEVFQTTTIFPSKTSNEQGSFGTSNIVPYAIIAVEGWLNEETARLNNLAEEDIDKMLSCLWLGIRDKNSRTKSNQTPRLLLEIVYQEFDYKFNPTKKVYKTIRNLDTLVKINSDIDDINIRKFSDFELQFDELMEECSKDSVKYVNFFTENKDLITKLELNSKFNFKNLI